ncbi:hypothetical protein D1013_00100 [Euzebyella marina]|uniref:Uncharacterized protein n=1 Tax=Euzebyella marina TaxID=1761453 RepID=A0A3G2L0W0_9FLAO|nr:hypothetical protein D1013_00100 [Euzebyella marina]
MTKTTILSLDIVITFWVITYGSIINRFKSSVPYLKRKSQVYKKIKNSIFRLSIPYFPPSICLQSTCPLNKEPQINLAV